MPELHAPYGGSTAARTMACPAWKQLAETLPKGNSSSVFADRGTLLHNAMEAIFQDDVDPISVIGMEYEGIVLTEELYLDKIVPAMAAAHEIFAKYGIDEWVCEEKVSLAEDAWGTSDVLGRGPGAAICLDWKFGDGIVVSPVESKQLLFYASAAYHTAETSDLFDDIDRVILAIVQPTSHRGEDYQVWETTIGRVRDFRGDFLIAVDKAEEEGAATCAGDHCKFCPASSICPQKNGDAQRALLMAPGDLETLTENLRLAHELEAWIGDVKAMAHTQMETGAEVKGWKLVMKRATRKWKDEAAALKSLARKAGGKKNIVNEKIMSPTQVEKVFKALDKKVDLDAFTESKSSGTTLAKASDKRPAVLSGAALQAALASVN
jgi:hypothetical protein